MMHKNQRQRVIFDISDSAHTTIMWNIFTTSDSAGPTGPAPPGVGVDVRFERRYTLDMVIQLGERVLFQGEEYLVSDIYLHDVRIWNEERELLVGKVCVQRDS